MPLHRLPPSRVSGAVKPADILEQIWVRDVVDRVCENFRRRRLKADLLAATAHESLKDILDTLTGFLRAVRAGASRRCRADVELLECSAWTVSRHLDPLLWWQKTRLPGLRLMVFYKPHPKKYWDCS